MHFFLVKFTAASFDEALLAAKKELGEDILVVTSKAFQVKSLVSGMVEDRVEITAAKPDLDHQK